MSGRVVFQHHGMAVLLQWWLNGQDVQENNNNNDNAHDKNVITAVKFLNNKVTVKLKTSFLNSPLKTTAELWLSRWDYAQMPSSSSWKKKKKVEVSRSYCCSNNSRSRCSAMKKCCSTSELERYQKKHFLHPFFFNVRVPSGPEPLKGMCPYDWMKLFPITFKWIDQFCSSWPGSWSSVSYWYQNYK